MRSGRRVVGACTRTATLRLVESTVPDTSTTVPTPSGSPFTDCPALNPTLIPGCTRATHPVGVTLKRMSSIDGSEISTSGCAGSADAPSVADSRVITPLIGDLSVDNSKQTRRAAASSASRLREIRGRLLRRSYTRDDPIVLEAHLPFVRRVPRPSSSPRRISESAASERRLIHLDERLTFASR